jgi:hypothetical protein
LNLRSLNGLAVSAALTLGLAATTLVTLPRSYADDDHAKCQRQIERAESRLGEAIRKHGEHSGQAEERRRDLSAERERCWNQYHGWWDAHEKRWHTERDWDRDRDHDRDHDGDDHH